MRKPDIIQRGAPAGGSPAREKRGPCVRLYSVVFFSTSVGRSTKLASVLSIAGIRVHQASTAAEVKILLRITNAAIVLLDQRTIGTGETLFRDLAADYPEACTVVLSPSGADAAQFCAADACEVVVEPARFLDLWMALESAREFRLELTDPVRLQSRVDAIMRAIQPASRGDRATPATRPSAGNPAAIGMLTMHAMRRFGRLH